MSKRKLSLQQQRRIASSQQRARPGTDKTESDFELGEPRQGLVITRYGKQADVLAAAGEPGDRPQRCHIRANIQDVVTGDKVIWRAGEPTGVIEAVLPRTSLMSRPDYRGVLRPVAANVTQMGIVLAPEPQPHQNLIDRYLVAAEELGIKPLLIFNKLDLLDNGDGSIEQLLALYRQLEYRMVKVSAAQALGLEHLRECLRGETTVLVGQSGVGKSSLLNRIYPGAKAITGDLSKIAKGRHTTTAASYYLLPSGGSLIDSPGIREFGLWHLEREQIARGFAEFRPFLGGCKFRDCRHFNEPEGAILGAVSEGRISRARHLSYQQIVNDLLG